MATITYSETLEVTRCWCGIGLAVPANLLRHALDGDTSIYCPLGHAFCWKETEADRLKKAIVEKDRQLARERALLDQAKADAEYQRRQAIAHKGAATKAKKRAAKGVCPAPGCKRSFVDVARHVSTCHPDIIGAEA